MTRLNPDIFKWARETAGLSLDDAAHAVGVRDAYGQTGEERLQALERGEWEPSRSQLARMAHRYRQPLVVFYLERPPRRSDRGQDFRVAPGAPKPEHDATLDALLCDIHARQDSVRSLREDEEAEPLAFVGSARMRQGASAVAESIVQEISFDRRRFRGQDSVADAFQYLRGRVEAAGVFVILAGNLGSHHTNISPETFRGFSLADPLAPFVVVNDRDAKPAWSFTVLHEVAHLWLGATGVSGGFGEAEIERFCNDVAGAVLLSTGEMRGLEGIAEADFEDTVSRISDFAEARHVSRAFVACNLLRAGFIGESLRRRLGERFRRDGLEDRGDARAKREWTGSGSGYYAARGHRLGSALLDLVRRSLDGGLITPTKAGLVLGVKPRNVAPLLLRGAGLPGRNGVGYNGTRGVDDPDAFFI